MHALPRHFESRQQLTRTSDALFHLHADATLFLVLPRNFSFQKQISTSRHEWKKLAFYLDGYRTFFLKFSFESYSTVFLSRSKFRFFFASIFFSTLFPLFCTSHSIFVYLSLFPSLSRTILYWYLNVSTLIRTSRVSQFFYRA